MNEQEKFEWICQRLVDLAAQLATAGQVVASLQYQVNELRRELDQLK